MARRTILVFSVLTTVVLASAATTPAHAKPKPAPKPRLTATAATVAETGAQAVVSLMLSKKAKKTVKVAWATKDGTAVAGSDYTASSGTVKIRKGKKAGSIRVPILDDATHEETETFTVTLASTQVRGPKPVTVTITDNDAPAPSAPPAPTSPSALVGTLTAVQSSMDGSTPVQTTLTMNVHLVPTATPGQWRDNGTGTWSITGGGTGSPLLCIQPNSTQVSGSGGFLTAAGSPVVGQANLLLSGFDPATATGSPALSWDGKGTAARTYYLFPTCSPIPSSGDWDFGQAPPGLIGSYTGTTGAGRGVSFSSGSPATTQLTGTLTPVP